MPSRQAEIQSRYSPVYWADFCIKSDSTDRNSVFTLFQIAANMALRLVKHVFTKYPVTANAVTFGSLYVTAEFSQQVVTKKVLVSGG